MTFVDDQVNILYKIIYGENDERAKFQFYGPPQKQEELEIALERPVIPEIYYKNLKVDWKSELIYIPFSPKTPLESFNEKGKIFMSKQVPLLICINLATEKETEAALRA